MYAELLELLSIIINMDLKNKKIVVTGATGGIGREIVKNLDSLGARLILVSRKEDELLALKESLSQKDHLFFACDFGDQKQVLAVAKKIFKQSNGVSVLINCAGVGVYLPLESISLNDWNSSFDINLTSVFIMTREFAKLSSNPKESLVLSIGSGAGVIPMAGRSLYCATKFALRGLILSLAEEYKRVGNPKFCLITLGSTLTSFGPLSLEQKKQEMEKGKAYFTTDWVSKKIVEIVQDENRETEYTIYPSNYGLGEWRVPEPK